MKKIIAFAGSNSKNSINKQLVTYTASLIDNADVTILDLNDFDLPLYGIDLEMEQGIPQAAYDFVDALKSSDGILLSLAEHNGSYTTVFKNIFDWTSRIDSKNFFGKPMLLMAASPGGRPAHPLRHSSRAHESARPGDPAVAGSVLSHSVSLHCAILLQGATECGRLFQPDGWGHA